MTPARIARYPGYLSLWAIWTAVAGLAYVRHYATQVQSGVDPRPWPEILIWLACFYPWIALAPLVFQLESRFPFTNLRNAAILIAASAGFTAVSLGTFILLANGIHSAFGEQFAQPKPPPGIRVSAFVFELFVFWFVVTAGYALRKLALLHEKENEMSRLALEKTRLEASLREAELEALRMRLNPHFLFNALQNISVLVENDPGAASRMLARLGDFLRAALRRDLQHEVTLEIELGLAEAYLEVEKMRFGDRLNIRMEIDDETRQAAVPTLLLQPLVENAIKHGLKSAGGGTIRLRSTCNNGHLILSVCDNGAGPPAGNLHDLEVGIGLGSASERLARLYPQQHELSMHKLPEGGTEVRVKLPFHSAPCRTPT